MTTFPLTDSWAGSRVNWTESEGIKKSSGSSTSILSLRDSDVEVERLRIGAGMSDDVLGLVAVGLVPERLRNVSGGVTLVVIMEGGCVFALNCAADTEGRKFFRGVLVPLTGRDVSDDISSPLADGPADEKVDPFCDFVSVDALPLRFRRMYFSIASASRSSIRVAIGDSAAAGLGKGGG